MKIKTYKTILLILFFIVAFMDIYAVIVENKSLEIIFKPLLMVSLFLVYISSVKKMNYWLVFGLFFSFLGDVLLLNQQKYFVFGVACFLITHVFYIRMITINLRKEKSFTKIILSIVPFVLCFLLVMFIVYENLQDMLAPVAEYGLVISVFGAVTLLYYEQEKSLGSLLLFLSAILLTFSDSFLILNIYNSYNKVLDFFVIFFYISSQYLVVKGVILNEESV